MMFSGVSGIDGGIWRVTGHPRGFLGISFCSVIVRENGGAKLDHRAANRSCFWAE